MQVTSLFFILKSTTVDIPYQAEHHEYNQGDFVILKTDDFSEEVAKIQKINVTKRKSSKIDLSGEILRQASKGDLQKIELNKAKEEEIHAVFKKDVESMGLDMHLVSVHYSLDGSLIYITFLSDERVDFRDLVKNIAKKFQKKIHLQQIGPRDKAKIKGGFGLCGQEFCCKKILGELPAVTMEAVRVQNMAYKGTDKLSGQCGKLMCCLNYESGQYRDSIDKFPKFGSSVTLLDKRTAIVVGLDVLNDKLKLKFENHQIETVSLQDLVK